MLARSSRFALALMAGAVGACSMYADGSNDHNLDDPSAAVQCVHDTIAECYLQQLPADVCADLVLTRCDLGGSTPTDPDCFEQVMQDCLLAGGDPMSCTLRADQACNGPGPGPDDDCLTRVFDECYAMIGDEMVCRAQAEQVCNGGCQPDGTGCDPNCPPGQPMCPGDCFDTVFQECLNAGIDPMTCAGRASEVCSGGCDPSDPMCQPCPPYDPMCQPCQPGDPNCEPPPPCDPDDPMCNPPPPCDPSDPMCNGGGDCHDQVFRDCLLQGLDPMTCEQLAIDACGGGTGCVPGDPMCEPPPPCPPNDPMCGGTPPPPCDPADPMCTYPPPGCGPNDPMCGGTPPPGCGPNDPMCGHP